MLTEILSYVLYFLLYAPVVFLSLCAMVVAGLISETTLMTIISLIFIIGRRED